MEPGDQIGAYSIQSKIGEGGMSAVYLALDSNDGTRVAVKELKHQYLSHQQLIDRFVRGATILKDLRHPHLARVFDVLEHNGRYIIVEEFLSGGSLADLLSHGGPPSEREALEWCRDALRALNYVHEFGIVHRDIKPSNLMLDDQRRVRVIDFGIARVFGEARLTRTGDGTMGTPWYMSPEQIQTPADVDHLTDVYSAGVVLYELLTGRVPFEGVSDFSIHEKITRQPPPPMSRLKQGINPALEKIVRKAIEKDPKQRHGGCGEFAQTIDRYLTPPLKQRWGEWPREAAGKVAALAPALARHRIAVGSLLVLIVLLVGLLNVNALSNVLGGRGTPGIRVVASARPSTVPAIDAVVTFTYEVMNTGNVPLRNVRVVDSGGTSPSLVSGDTNGNGVLDASEMWIFESRFKVERSQWDAGRLLARTFVASSDRAASEPFSLDVPFDRRPAIAIVALVNGAGSAQVHAPGRLSYSYTVKNSGNVALTNVRVFDRHNVSPNLRGGDSNGNRVLDVGEVWEYRADINVTKQEAQTGDSFTSRAVAVADEARADAGEVRVSVVRQPPPAVIAGTTVPPPRKLRNVPPVYPPEAQAANVQGTVRLELTIGPDGRVQDVRVLRSASEPTATPAVAQLRALLERAAIDAARQWEYAPTVLNGVAVPVITTALVQFVLTPPVRVDGAIKAPEKTRHAAPQYPAIAQSARVQGVVVLDTTVGIDGHVRDARVLRSVPLLDAAALDAVRQWEFTPTTLNGTPVPVVVTPTVELSLH